MATRRDRGGLHVQCLARERGMEDCVCEGEVAVRDGAGELEGNGEAEDEMGRFFPPFFLFAQVNPPSLPGLRIIRG